MYKEILLSGKDTKIDELLNNNKEMKNQIKELLKFGRNTKVQNEKLNDNIDDLKEDISDLNRDIDNLNDNIEDIKN